MTLLTLQKTLALLLLPAGLLWVLLLVASGLCFRKRRWTPASLLLGFAFLYAAAGNQYVGAALLGRLEVAVPPVELATVEPFDAVFVLGGGSSEDPQGRPQLSFAGDRILMAARLWHAGKAGLLVASGAGRDGLRGHRDCGEETRSLWRAMGVPDQAIRVVEEPCLITRDEIAAYTRLQARYGWKRMALVSSASHLPRALVLADKAGLRVTPVGANWASQPHAFDLRFLVPQAEGFMAVHLACWEVLGRWVGR